MRSTVRSGRRLMVTPTGRPHAHLPLRAPPGVSPLVPPRPTPSHPRLRRAAPHSRFNRPRFEVEPPFMQATGSCATQCILCGTGNLQDVAQLGATGGDVGADRRTPETPAPRAA